MRRLLAIVFSVMVASVFALAGCSSSNDAKANFMIDEGTVSVEGNILTITLDGDPNAGFDWAFSTSSDSLLLKETSYKAYSENEQKTPDEDTIDPDMAVDGETSVYGGAYTFIIEGTTAGEGTVKLDYILDTAKSVSISYSFEVKTEGDGNITSVKAYKNGNIAGMAVIAA